MKLLVLAAVCVFAITTTHGFAIGIPPFGRIGVPPFGARIHPFGLGVHPFGAGIHPFGPVVPPFGLGIPHIDLGAHIGVASGLQQGLVQPGLQNVGNIHANDYGPGYIGDINAQRASAAAATAPAGPATGGAAASAPLGTAYVPAFTGF